MRLKKCDTCQGGGTILSEDSPHEKFLEIFEELCPDCEGHGKRIVFGVDEDPLQAAYLVLKYIIEDFSLYGAEEKIKAAAEALDQLMSDIALAAYEQRMEP